MNFHFVKNILPHRRDDAEDAEETEFFPDDEEAEFFLDIENNGRDFENGRFLNSVEQLSEEDVELSATTVRKTPSDLPRKIAFAFFSVTFILSCAMLIQNLVSKYKAAQIYDRLEEEFFSAGFQFDVTDAQPVDEGEVGRLKADVELSGMATMSENLEKLHSEDDSETEIEKKEYNEELEKMRAGLASLAQINPDIYGWITVEGTAINYPLVQGEDNDYYLSHAYTGDYLPEGSIFVDYHNSKSITKNYNTVFYGHNITTGAMFHDVTKFFKDSYMNGAYIYVYTYDGVYIYEPFSVYESRYDYNYFKTGFTGAEDFIAFAEEVRDNSAVAKKDVSFGENDRLLTLSTCTNGVYTQRYALHARLIKTITD